MSHRSPSSVVPLESRADNRFRDQAALYLLSIAQQFHVNQCLGGMSHCNLFCALTLYFMLSHVLDFGGTL